MAFFASFSASFFVGHVPQQCFGSGCPGVRVAPSLLESTSSRDSRLTPRPFPSLMLLFVTIGVFYTSTLLAQDTLKLDSLANYYIPEVPIISSFADKEDPLIQYNFNKEKITQNAQSKDLPYLLSQSPSAVFTSDDGLGVGYTGLRIRGSDATRTSVNINGVPLNDGESGQVYWVDLPDLIESADQIQIQRGVGTTSQGTSSFGASVNIATFRPQDPNLVLSTYIGRFGTRKYHLRGSSGLVRNKIAMEAGVSSIKSGGYIDRAKSNLTSAFINLHLALKNGFMHLLGRQGQERTYQAWYGLPHQYLETNRTYNPSGLITSSGTFYDNEVDDYTQKHLQYLWEQKFSSRFYSKLTLYATFGKGFYEQYKNNARLSNYKIPPIEIQDTLREKSDLVTQKWLDNSLYGGIWTIDAKSKAFEELNAGIHISRYKGDHFGRVIWAKFHPIDAIPSEFYFDQGNKSEFSIFAKSRKKLSEKLRLFLDIQYRHVQYQIDTFEQGGLYLAKRTYHFLNPKIGGAYAFDPKHSFNLYFGIANKEPFRDDFEGEVAGIKVQPERLYNAELTYKYKMAAGELVANLFYMNYHNQLVVNGLINDVGAAQRINIPNSFRLGLELSGFFTWKNFQLESHWTLSKNKITNFDYYIDNWDSGTPDKVHLSDVDLAFSPNIILKNSLNYTMKRFSLVLSQNYVGSQFIDNTGSKFRKLPDYTTFDFQVFWRPLKNYNLRLEATIFNLLNQKYVSNAWTYPFTSTQYDPTADDIYANKGQNNGDYQLTGYFPQATRHWALGLRWAF